METQKYHLTASAREARRVRAWELNEQGWKQKDIAAALGVTEAAVSRWLTRAATEGAASLRARPRIGAKPRLTPEQKARIPALLDQGASAHGFQGEVWTQGRIAVVIREAFGIRCDPATGGRWLREIGWSRQKPRKVARQQKAEEVERFLTKQLPEVKSTVKPEVKKGL